MQKCIFFFLLSVCYIILGNPKSINSATECKSVLMSLKLAWPMRILLGRNKMRKKYCNNRSLTPPCADWVRTKNLWKPHKNGRAPS
ncbi:hypothetical protein V1521DRAFT_436313 [Lipomyces starkeyi]